MSLKLATKGRLLIRRFNLESVIIDGISNRFKNPQLVIKPEVEPGFRHPNVGSQSGNRLPTRRQVLMVHVKDKASELVSISSSFYTVEPSLTRFYTGKAIS